MNRKVAHPVLTGLLLIPFLLGVLAAPTAALGPGPGPVQPIPPAQLDRSTRFVGASVRATTDPLKSQQLLGNPGFEAGTWLPWEAFGAPALDGAIRHGGSLSAHLGNADSANDQAIQAVAIPAGAGEITLDFWYRIESGETVAGADFFCYGVWDSSGTTAVVEHCLDLGLAGSHAWGRETYSLTADERAGVAGQNVLVAFLVVTNAAQPSRAWVDDTALTVVTSTQRKVFLPLVAKSSTTPPPPPPTETGAFWLPYIGGNSMLPTYGTSVAMDVTGGMHAGYALYSGLDNGARPAYYAYCAAGCAAPANWSLTRVGDNVQDVRLALNPQTGRPRMLLFTSDLDSGKYGYQCAACEGGCTNSANWTLAVITTNYEIPSRRTYKNNRYFAIDPYGGPAFVYTDNGDGHTGTFYAHCTSACTDAGSWSEYMLFEQGLIRPALAFAPNGQPRLAGSYYVPDDPQYEVPLWKLFYGGCFDNCESLPQSQWDGTFLVPTIGDGSFSLRIDADGRPRMALYPTSADLSQMEPGKLYYLWCDDATCLDPDAWNKASVGTPIAHGEGVDLALDPAGRPRLAFQAGDVGLGYARCDANCGLTASWQAATLESTASIIAQYPPELPEHQGCPILTWLHGVRPSLALDSAGNPRVGYDAELWWGGSNPYIECDIAVPVARFGLFNQP